MDISMVAAVCVVMLIVVIAILPRDNSSDHPPPGTSEQSPPETFDQPHAELMMEDTYREPRLEQASNHTNPAYHVPSWGPNGIPSNGPIVQPRLAPRPGEKLSPLEYNHYAGHTPTLGPAQRAYVPDSSDASIFATMHHPGPGAGDHHLGELPNAMQSKPQLRPGIHYPVEDSSPSAPQYRVLRDPDHEPFIGGMSYD
jgi:hypothetical protein